MSKKSSFASLTAAVVMGLFALCLHFPVAAQEPQQADSNVLLDLEIVTPRQGTNLLASQRWGSFFRDQGEVVRVREPLADDKPGATETSRGTFRLVKVVALMDRDGQLHVPGHKLTLNQPDKVQEWLKELKTYGAQGDPEGQPRWGLNEEQFKAVYAALSVPVVESQQGRPLSEVMKSLPLPVDFPLRVHAEAAPLFETAGQEPVKDDIQGLSLGTALAGTLVQQGFGFRPRRTPSGTLELVVESLSKISDPWPVGWTVDPAKRKEVAPQLFKSVAAGFENQPLDDVLHAISTQQQVPILCNRAACATREIDLHNLVTYPMRSVTMWMMVLDSSVRQSKLEAFIRRDEVGQPLVYVTPFEPKRPPQP